MKYKDLLKNNPFTAALILFSLLVSGITFCFSVPLAAAELACAAVLSFFLVSRVLHTVDRKKEYLRCLESSFASSGDIGKKTLSFPFPFVLVNGRGDIEWFNAAFENILVRVTRADGNNIRCFISDTERFLKRNDFSAFSMRTETSDYTVYPVQIDGDLYCLYFAEDTELKEISRKYAVSRPAVLLINADSLEQTEDNLAHADYSAVISDVEREITKWLVENGCIFRKFADGKFFAATECAQLDGMVKRDFDILDKIRLYRFGGKEMDITLSIGVGRGSNLAECEADARLALDMARGRGGDQVALKNGEHYEFFGGITSRKEKRGKIKSRFFSATLDEYIGSSSAVFIMGHSYSDFDAIGSAVGVAAIARACRKSVHIIVNEKTSLALPLVRLFDGSEEASMFISPYDALLIADENDLLVITDTMRANLLDAPELFEKTGRKFIIDHHRMTVDRISAEGQLFHEPYASSACEMVTELVQYAPSAPELNRHEAEALLAGMVLDTRNFSLRVGTRTFEAAAYLRDCGADTVTVRKLFAGSVDENIEVSRLVARAEFYKGYAIAADEDEKGVSRIVASKAADELLNIRSVDASFVITRSEDTVFVSARSLGKVNVQLVMESFGGGGHQSMAACRISGGDVAAVKERLVAGVDAYMKKNC